MKNRKLIFTTIILVGFIFTGYLFASPYLTAARLAIKSKNYEKALRLLKKEILEDPESNEGFYWLGFVYGQFNEIDKMIDAYNKSLALSDEFKKEISSAKLSFWARAFNDGVKNFQNATKTNILDSSKAYYNKSAIAFKRAIKIQPDSLSSYKNLAFVLLNAGRDDDAISPLQTLIDKEKSRDGYRLLGKIYYQKAKSLKSKYFTSKIAQDSIAYMAMFDKAIGVLEVGRKIFPNDSNILLELSNSYIGAKKTKIALEAFKHGVEQEPDNKYYHYNYAVLLLGLNKYEEAITQFKEAERIDPEYENAIYNIGVVYVQWGDTMLKENDEKGEKSDNYKPKYEAALPYLEKVVQLVSDDPSIWETLGKVYTRLGKTNDATNAFKKSDELRK